MKKRGFASLIISASLLVLAPAEAQTYYYSKLLNQRLTLAPAVIPATGIYGTSVGSPYGSAYGSPYGYPAGYSPVPTGFATNPYLVMQYRMAQQQQWAQQQAQQQRNAQLLRLTPIAGLAIGMLAGNLFNSMGSMGSSNASSYSQPASYASNNSGDSYQSSTRVAAPAAEPNSDIPANPPAVITADRNAARTPAAQSARPLYNDANSAAPATQRAAPRTLNSNDAGQAQHDSLAQASEQPDAKPSARASAAPSARVSSSQPARSPTAPSGETCVTKFDPQATGEEKALLDTIKKISNCSVGKNGTRFTISTAGPIVVHITQLPPEALTAATQQASAYAPLGITPPEFVVMDHIKAAGLQTTFCKSGNNITARLVGTGDLKGRKGNLEIKMGGGGCFTGTGSIVGGDKTTTEAFGVR